MDIHDAAPSAANGNERVRRLHETPLGELLAHPDAPDWMCADWERHVRDGWADLERQAATVDLLAVAVPCSVTGYLAALQGDAHTGCVILYEASTGRPVGGVFDGNLHVYPAHRGRGLAAEAMRLAFDAGIKRVEEHVVLSAGGRAARRAAHRNAVWHALASGIQVGIDILADHPDLAVVGRSAGNGERT